MNAETRGPSLTPSEAAHLWNNVMVDSMAVQCIEHFLAKCEDADISEMLSYALRLSRAHVETAGTLLREDGHPAPVGFTNDDVVVDAPRLFSDEFVLLYMHQLSNTGLMAYSKALATVARRDVHRFYEECIASTVELNGRTKTLLLSKGLYVRPPSVPLPNNTEPVESQGFLRGFLGEKRPMMVHELMNAFYNLQTLEMVRTLMIGFAQVSKTEEVAKYFERGKTIASHACDRFVKLFHDEELPAPTPSNMLVTDSVAAPFSEKLMMFHCSILNGAGVEQLGYSMASGMRRDIGALYMALLPRMLTYVDDGASLMIRHGWLEQPPLNADRKRLTFA